MKKALLIFLNSILKDFAFQMLQIISFLFMLICLQKVIATMIDVKPTTLEFEAKIKCYKTSEARRTGGGYLNRELLTIGSDTKIRGRKHYGYVTYIKPDLRKCDQSDPTAFIQITDLLSREMKQFQMEKSELDERITLFVIGFNIEPSAIKKFHAKPSSPIAKEIQIGCFNSTERNRIAVGSAYNKNSHRSISIPIYETELLSECERGIINIKCVVESKYINLEIPQSLFLQYEDFNYDIRPRTIEPVEVGGVNTSTGQNEASTSVQTPLCTICEDNQLEIAFIPCGHSISCCQCADKIKNCPICRRKIEKKLRIFLS